MSTLQEALRERRGIDPRAFINKPGTNSPARTLAVASWEKRSWHFPWSCLTKFEHDGSGVPEILRLCFGTEEVVVEGKWLALLLPEISALRLESICEMPPWGEDLVGENTPVIRKVTVGKRMADAPSAPAKS